ncbi:hypothetical protein HKD37_16G045810 [Glycine soja]
MNNYWLQKRHLVWRVPFSLICGCKGRGGSFGVSVTRRLTLLSHIEQKLMAEKTKKKLEETAQSGSTEAVIDPSSPIRRHMKWKMTRTKKTEQMTYAATKEIAEKIDSLEEQASQGSFVSHGRQDVLTTTIGQPEHPGRVRAAGAGVTIKQYFGSTPQTSRTSSSMAPKELEQLTQQIRDQLEESITEKVTRQLMLSFSQMQSQFQSQMQSQGLALPPEPEVGPSAARVSTKESCVDPSGNDPDMGDSNKYELYIEENPPRLVSLGRVYKGSTIVHNIPLMHDQVKVGVEEVKDADALVPVPTDEVMWDVTVFEVFNEDFPLYIKHENLSEIAHGGQCLSISVIQLWILALKGLDDTSQPKSKAGARWIVVKVSDLKKASTYIYFMPLEAERLKALRIQWTQYYLKVRNQT